MLPEKAVRTAAEKAAAHIQAKSAAQHDLERTGRIVAMLGALGLGIGLSLTETRNPWVTGN